METLPLYLPVLFIAATLVAVIFFYKATHGSKTALLVIAGWLALQFFIARTGFYTITSGIPPRFALVLLPPLLAMAGLFATRNGRAYMARLDASWLTLLHTVRIPVEIGLYWLALHKAVPQLMTFEGRNFDLISGVTAPLVFYIGFAAKRLNRKALLIWNVVCLALLINIIVIAILTAPFEFQKLAFNQPNIAVLHFPFVWLPCCIVPLVLFSHLACIYQLAGKTNTPQTVLPQVTNAHFISID